MSTPARTGKNRAARLTAYLFLAPTVLGVGLFTVVPIVGSVVLSFFHWDVIDPPAYAGLDNYRELTADTSILTAFRNTLLFMVLAVTLQLVVALALALALQGRMPRWIQQA